MKDFTHAGKDREFTINGYVFNWHDVRPEVLTELGNSLTEESNNGAKSDPDPNLAWKIADRQIMLFIEADQHERWIELRERDKDPVTIGQLNAIVQWLMEEQTGLPTVQPSSSGTGRGRTATSSKGE